MTNIEKLKELGIVSVIRYWRNTLGDKIPDHYRAKIAGHNLYIFNYASYTRCYQEAYTAYGRKDGPVYRQILPEQFIDKMDESMRKRVLFNMDLIL